MSLTSIPYFVKTIRVSTVLFLITAILLGAYGLSKAPRASASTTELFFSEYIEGTSNNKALEIFNGTGAAVDLEAAGYNVQMFFNGSTSAGLTINLTGTVANGDVFVLAHSSASAPILAQADQTNGAGWYNGDDAVVLRKGISVIDVIGQVGFDPGTEWGSGLTSTADNTLRRKSTICAGDPNGSDAFDPSVEWDGFATDTFDGLGFHTTQCGDPSPTPTPTPTPSPSPSPSPSPVADFVIINELDSDTPGTDMAEFVELYDGGVGNTPLDGLVVVFYNGNGDVSYAAFDLDGFSTDSNGYFVLGNAAVPGVDLIFANNSLQNGEDAVALYAGNATDFPNGTPVTTNNVIDAVVYDTDDPDDPGLLVLLNPGEPQVNENGGGDGTNHSIQRCRNGSGGARNTSTYLARTPTPKAENNCPPPPPPPVLAAIHEIQGDGPASPLIGQTVITSGIVTAHKSNGFFMQTPDDSVDLDPATSEGIFVFTSSPPTALVGDFVTVTAAVVEFFNLTELTSPTITVNSSGNLLPTPITLTTTILNPNGPLDQLERFEGMRVHAPSLVSVAPTNNFGEIHTVLEGVPRPMREPGIEASLPIPPDPTTGVQDCCIPIWDKNPERIVIDTDGLAGAPVVSVTSNVSFSNVTGPLDFTFNEYKILPETPPTSTGGMSAIPVPIPAANEFTVASFNIENFNNSATQRQKAALAIRDVLRLPHVIGVAEIFELQGLQALAAEINSIASGVNYEAHLIEADGTSGDSDQDVGFLVDISRVQIDSVVQEELAGCNGTAATCYTFTNPNNNQQELLNDRPSLVLRATANPFGVNPTPVIIVVNHLRSFIGIETLTGDGPRVRAKRKAQSEFLANLLQNLQFNNPTTAVISIGDYNAYQFSDGYTDPIATIKGIPTPTEQIVVDESLDVVDPDFINLTDLLPEEERYTFIFQGTPQALDHVLVNTVAHSYFQRYAIGRSNADFPSVPFSLFAGDASRPERSSDHDMPVAYFTFPKAATTTTVSNASVVLSSNDQSVTLSAEVNAAAGTVNEGTVTFTITDVDNSLIGLPVNGAVSNGVATATYIVPGGTQPQALTITGEFSGGDFTLTSAGAGTLAITYNICLLYDPTKSVKQNATIPIRIQLCDGMGANVSSSTITVHALGISQVSNSASEDLLEIESAANPDNNFRFDATLGGTGGYIYNLRTTGLAGTYHLYFTAGSDPVTHTVSFQVKP